MKHLYQTVVERDALLLGKSPAAPAGAPNEAIAAAERKLGVPFPKTFKRFTKEVGPTTWPVEIFSAEAIAAHHKDDPLPGRPAHLVAFATDGGGNDWCFDTRKLEGGEYPILFWDHEEPPEAAEVAEPGMAKSFDDWLEGHVSSHLAEDERKALADRLQRFEQALAPHRATNVWPHAPSREEVAAIEATLHVSLPKDYVAFTTHLGSTMWPLEIVDAQGIERLTEELRQRFGSRARGVVAFGREPHGGFVGFEKRGKLVTFGGYPTEDLTFFDFLERRIRERAGAKAPTEAGGAAASAGNAQAAAPGGPPEQADIPYGIGNDDRINSVWRAVAKASRYTVTPTPDGRLEVSINDFEGGKRRMFIDKATWSTIEKHLALLRK